VLWARELRDRYASMDDVLADLRRVERGEAPLGAAPCTGEPAASSRCLGWSVEHS
jgi:hypothetical protein